MSTELDELITTARKALNDYLDALGEDMPEQPEYMERYRLAWRALQDHTGATREQVNRLVFRDRKTTLR